MENPLTVVVSDETILPEICGANDSNLKVIEELLGVRVFSRGNEILLDTSGRFAAKDIHAAAAAAPGPYPSGPAPGS